MDNAHFEMQLASIAAYLRGELGYDADSPGSLRRQVDEHAQALRAIDDVLRGAGDELGLVGWVMVIRRTWIALVGLLGAAAGYMLNDVVDALKST